MLAGGLLHNDFVFRSCRESEPSFIFIPICKTHTAIKLPKTCNSQSSPTSGMAGGGSRHSRAPGLYHRQRLQLLYFLCM